MKVETVLVAYDFSAHSDRALHWGVEVAKVYHAKLVLVHALPVLHHALALPGPMMLQLDNDRLARAEQDLRDVHERTEAARGHPVERYVVRGDPFWEICQAVRRFAADLVVMGSHGRTGLSHVLLGSVAERVVRHACCPVLVARGPHVG